MEGGKGRSGRDGQIKRENKEEKEVRIGKNKGGQAGRNMKKSMV